jgi:hypothetical protein
MQLKYKLVLKPHGRSACLPFCRALHSSCYLLQTWCACGLPSPSSNTEFPMPTSSKPLAWVRGSCCDMLAPLACSPRILCLVLICVRFGCLKSGNTLHYVFGALHKIWKAWQCKLEKGTPTGGHWGQQCISVYKSKESKTCTWSWWRNRGLVAAYCTEHLHCICLTLT